MTDVAQERLPCGAGLGDLLTQVADAELARDPVHQRSCPHCRAALAELMQLWEPVQALAAEDPRAPAGLLAGVMNRVRALAEDAWHAVLETDRGSTRVAAWVIGAIARVAAQQVPRVALAYGRSRTAQDQRLSRIAGPAWDVASQVGVAGTQTVIDLDIAVEMGYDIADLTGQVRHTVSREVTRLTGVTVAEVNLTVVDVWG